jgi:hypothetical protein
MKRYVTLLIILTIGWAVAALGIQSVHAAPQATYALVQSYIGPGGSGSAGIYGVSSSIGQPAAGKVSAGIYTFGGGFWGGGIIVPVQNHYEVYLPLVLR